MDANHLSMILSNIEYGYNKSQIAAREALEREGFDWDNPDDNHEPENYYLAIGEAIHDFLTEEIGKVIDDNSLIGIIFGDTLNHIEWREVGKDFYAGAAESED